MSAILPLISIMEFSTCLRWGGMAPFFSHLYCWFHWTRYSCYILQVRWINLQSSDVAFLLDSVYQKSYSSFSVLNAVFFLVICGWLWKELVSGAETRTQTDLEMDRRLLQMLEVAIIDRRVVKWTGYCFLVTLLCSVLNRQIFCIVL